MGKLCEHEFNAQMQAMQSRVDNLEYNVRQQMLVSVYDITKTHMALVAGGVTEAAAAEYIADPFIAAIIVGYLDRGVYDTIMGMLSAVPGMDLEELFADLVLEGIGVPPYGGSLMDTITAKVAQAVADAQQALDDAIGGGASEEEIAELASILEAAQQVQANADGLFGALNNLAACKGASFVLQAGGNNDCRNGL